MSGRRRYRICRACGKEVNVSCIGPHEKKYVCPRCAGEPWYMTRFEPREETS